MNGKEGTRLETNVGVLHLEAGTRQGTAELLGFAHRMPSP
jgi:hypothetical protein